MKVGNITALFLISLFAAFTLVQGVESAGGGPDAPNGGNYQGEFGTPDNDTSEFALGPKGTLIRACRIDPWLTKTEAGFCQLMWVDLAHAGEAADLTLHATGIDPMKIRLPPGNQTIEIPLPPVKTRTTVTVKIKNRGRTIAVRQAEQGPATLREPADWVDPILRTSQGRWMLYQGPSMPFGMVKLSPDNQAQQSKAGYEYLVSNIAGFSHLHSRTMGGLLTMPTIGELKITSGSEDDPDKGYRSKFSRENEFASPGYYAVTLDDYNIRAELTATTRVGFQRYTFPNADSASILFDLETPSESGCRVLDAKITKVSDTEIEGYSRQQSGRDTSLQQFTLHFVARVSKPFDSLGGWVAGQIKENVTTISGKGDVGAFLKFSTRQGEVIKLKTGISFVSIEQARLNLEAETAQFGWDFYAARVNARRVWNELLGKIEIEGGSHEQKTRFYTNLYRSYCAGTIISDINGKYVDMHGPVLRSELRRAAKVRQLKDPESPVYDCDAFRHTFWSLNQLWTLLTPDIANKQVCSLLEIYDKGGWLPEGPAGIKYSDTMAASHEIALIVGAYQKGIRNYDIATAYEAIRQIQTELGQPDKGGGYIGNKPLKSYIDLGYVPVEEGPVSNTLEYAYDDWCVAQMAKALDKKDDYELFMKRAENYKNVFDPSVGYVRQKHSNGQWVKEFSPYSGQGFVEGNSWQYTWFVPHDVEGLIRLIGKDEFNKRLNEGFIKSAKGKFNSVGPPGAESSDRPIDHGNQLSMQAAYLFNFSGQPWLAQKWAREIMEQYYVPGPIDGYAGDEDPGLMAAWYVMSAMGLFEMDGGCAVQPTYEIGSPIFDKVTIRLDDRYYKGGTYIIEARDNSKENIYIQSATLDGHPLNKPWFYHHQLADGGTLTLQMGPEPNREWASSPKAAPPSMTE